MKQWKKILAGTLCGCMVLQTGMTNVFAETTQPVTEVSEDDTVSEQPDATEQEPVSTEVDVKDVKEDVQVQDTEQTLGTVKQLFPDEGFRYLVLAMLNDGYDEPKYTADSEVTQSELDNINQIDVDYVDNKMPAAVKSVEGLQYLTNIWCLGLDEQDVTDVTTGIDWSKFTKLETVHLQGNLLTDIPDWTKCKELSYVDVSKNKLGEEKNYYQNVPAKTDISYEDQNPGTLSLQMNSEFYLDENGNVLLEARANGGRKSAEYADFIYKVDNKEVSAANDYRFRASVQLSVGTHTLSLQVKQYGVLVDEVKPQTFTVVKDKQLGALNVLFPDASLRKLVINELKDQGSDADIKDDTIVSTGKLADVTEIYAGNLDKDDQPVKNLAGVEYLTNLQWLTLRNQDISDVTSIDWSKLTRLQSLDLSGNLLTKLPDLSKCEKLDEVYLDRNKLSNEEIAKIDSKLPVNYDGYISYYDQCVNGVQEIVEDTYYMSAEGKAILAFGIEGSRKTDYTVTYYVDNQKVFSKVVEDGNSTIGDCVTLTEGSHTAYAVVTYPDGSEVKTKETTFSLVNAPIIQRDTTDIYSTKDNVNSLYWQGLNLSGKEAAKIAIVKGNTVIGETSEVSSYEYGSSSLYKKVNTYIDGLKVMRISGMIQRVDNGKLLAVGNYDVMVTMTDGTKETLKNAITVTDEPFVSYVSGGYGYNNGGDYIYLRLTGNKIDPTVLNYEISDSTGAIKPVVYVNYKKVSDEQVIVKLKKQDWKVKDGQSYRIVLTKKDGANVIIAKTVFSSGFSDGIYFFEYNSAKNAYEIGYAGDDGATSVTCEILENYNSENVLASATAEIKNGFAYFVPKKADGSVYVPDSNGQVYGKFTIGKKVYYDSAYYNMSQNTERSPYWGVNGVLVSKKDGTFVTRFMTETEYSSVNMADYSFGLFQNGKQVNVRWNNIRLEKYNSGRQDDNVFKGMICGDLPLSALEAGQYTLIAFYKNQQVSTAQFQLIDTDKFVLYSKSAPYMSWQDKNHILLGFTTNLHNAEDDYNITFTDEDGNVVKGLSCKVAYKDTSSNWVSYSITGLNYNNSKKRYYLKITHKTLGDPIDENGKAFYADTKGTLTQIYKLNQGGVRTDASGRVNRAVFTNMDYPVTIRVYSTRDTDVLYQKQIAEAEVSKDEDGTGYYIFGKDLYNQIPDIDEKYDISIVDATGAFYVAQGMFLSKENQGNAKELSIQASSSTIEAAVEDKVVITANAAGGTAPYTYSYLVHNKDTNSWARLSGFVKDTSLVWTAGSAGNREFFAEVKDSTGKVVRSAAVNVKVKSGLTISAKSSTDNAFTGSKVVITANAVGGTAPYTYSYLVCNRKTDKWARLTGFVKDASYTWIAGDAGDRDFYVEVKDSTGKVVRSKAIKVAVVSGLSVTGTASVSNAASGEKVVIKANATNGTAPYTYSYLVCNRKTDKWARLTGFVKDASYTWIAGDAGDRDFYVEVKDSTGKVVRSKAIKVAVVSGLSVTGTASALNAASGEKVVIKANATNGTAPYTYSYLVCNRKTDKWARLTGFVKDASYTWIAGDAGTRDFYIEVKDSTGKVVRSKAVTVAVGGMTINATATKSEIKVGEKVTIQGVVNNGSAPYTYSYLICNRKDEKWFRLTGFVKDTSYTWTAGSTGNRDFYVEVKDSTGKVVRSKAVTVVVK